MDVRSLSLRTLLVLVLATFVFTGCPAETPDPPEDIQEDTPAEVDVETEVGEIDAEPDEDVCVPDCGEIECGLDPVCGSLDCGTCEDGWDCVEGICEEIICVPDCGVAVCGLDPVCGTLDCGACEDDFHCEDGVCEPDECVPDCGVAECGLDPVCGTEDCGTCEEGFECVEGLCDNCFLDCEEHADCDDFFSADELGACLEPRCVWDETCDDDGDWQCAMEPVEDFLCCDTVDDCPDGNECQNVDCVLNHCIYSKIPDCCLVPPSILYSLNFNNLEPGQVPDLVAMALDDVDPLDAVTWTAQENPCGDGMALYLGDPACGTYFNGELYNCEPVENIDCVTDQDCPGSTTCNTAGGLNKCDGEPATPVEFEAVIFDVVLPVDSLVSLFYTLRTDLEPVVGGFAFDTLKLYAEYTEDMDPVEVQLHAAPQSTNGDCTVFAADLSAFAPVSVPGVDVDDGLITLIWRFDTFDAENNHFPGLWLDDIQVETWCDNCFSASNCDDDDVCTVDDCVGPPVFGSEDGLCYNTPIFADCVACPGGADDCAASNPEGYLWDCAPEGYCVYFPDPDLCVPPVDGTQYLLDAGLEEAELPAEWEVTDPAGEDVAWAVTNATACDGSYALYFGNGDDYDCGQALCEGSVTTPEIDLSGVEEIFDLRLSFCANMSTEWDKFDQAAYPADNAHTVQIDVLYVEVLVGDEVTEVWNSDVLYGTTYALWADAWTDLSPFKGQTIRLRYRFYTGTAEPANNDSAGIFIDNIRIEKVCGAICGTAADCTEGGDCTTAACDFGACAYPIDPECCTEEINFDCDDGNPCTDDVCQMSDNTCQHNFNGAPDCCSPNPSVFADSFLSADQVAWYVPEDIASCGVFPFECDDTEGENCMTCPTDCGACPVRWNVTAYQSFTAPFSLYFGNLAQGNYYNGQEPARGFMASPDVVLPPYGIPAVSFHLWLDTEYTPIWDLFEKPEDFDVLRVHVQPKSGGTYGEMTEIWNSLAWDFKGSTFDGAQDDVIWKTVYVALDGMNLEGATVRFVFEFDSYDEDNNDHQGAYVDDFKIFTLCDEAFECLSAYDCAESTPEPEDPDCSVELCDGANGAAGIGGTCIAEANALLDGCCVQEVVIGTTSDFDADCGMEDWIASPTADQTPVAWQIWGEADGGENYTPGGECALYFGNPEAGNYDLPGETPQGTVTSPAWEIPAGLEAEVEVSFWLWMDLGDAWSLTDVLSLHMGLKFHPTLPSIGTKIWSKPCHQSQDCSDPLFQSYCDDWGCTAWPWGQWKHVTVVIPTASFQGYSHLDFWFMFNAQDDTNNDSVGVFVDDFEVKTTCQ